MAIALTTQPTSDGAYSAYLRLNFVATETTNNPDYLLFTLKTSAGASIDGIPSYKAPNISNTYTFDASAYLRSFFDVRQFPTSVSNTIQVMTDLFAKFEVVVSDPINSLTSLTSNEFFAFPHIENVIGTNTQSAFYAINDKRLFYEGAVKNVSATGTQINPLPSHTIGAYDCVYIWVKASATASLYIDTYEGYTPNNSTTIKQTLTVSLASYSNQLVRVPLNGTYFATLATVLKYQSFKVRYANIGAFYIGNQYCSFKEFLYVNRYGVVQNIVFKTLDNQGVTIAGNEFTNGSYDLINDAVAFNFGGDTEKINIDIKETIDVEGQKFSKLHKDVLLDFVSSPIHGLVVGGYVKKVNVNNGSFKLIEDSKGLEFSFKCTISQKRPSFL